MRDLFLILGGALCGAAGDPLMAHDWFLFAWDMVPGVVILLCALKPWRERC